MATSILASLQSVIGFGQDCNLSPSFPPPLTRREYRMGRRNLRFVIFRLREWASAVRSLARHASVATGRLPRSFAAEGSICVDSLVAARRTALVGSRADCPALRSRNGWRSAPSPSPIPAKAMAHALPRIPQPEAPQAPGPGRRPTWRHGQRVSHAESRSTRGRTFHAS